MSRKVTALDHMKSCALAAKNFANGLVAELATATSEAIEEMDSRINALDEQIGGFSYSEANETLTIPAANGTVADETLVLK